jgi:hypothetical protein
VVTFPDTGSGTYERINAWLNAAGAPYATDQLGIIWSIASSSSGAGPSDWSSSYAYLFPRDLLDFTNKATVNGAPFSDCASPLTSASTCGFTVGSYDLQLPSGISYGGINGHWKSVPADVLLFLLAPYNDKAFGTTSGTLGDFMASIGFSESLKSGGLIVTTANTGKNGDTGSEAICFMDMASLRDKSKQPWCDGIKNQVQGTDNLLDFKSSSTCDSAKEHTWTKDLASQPAFYTADWDACFGWSTKPGWLESEQNDPGNKQSTFYQYHWPVIDVSEIGCQNGKPYTNPGGLLSRCAGDLQEYVDALLPPPDRDTTALAANGDAPLSPEEPNRNFGEAPLLTLGGRDGHAFVVQFEDARIQSFVDGGELTSAILRLSVAGRGSAKRLAIAPIFDGFVEGKSTVGTGATWNCAEDADISDDDEDCLQQWPPSLFVDGDPRRPDQHDRRAGLLGWDVTEDVNAEAYAWAIRAASGTRAAIAAPAAAPSKPARAPRSCARRSGRRPCCWSGNRRTTAPSRRSRAPRSCARRSGRRPCCWSGNRRTTAPSRRSRTPRRGGSRSQRS